jgi:hypothetical protein
MVQDKKVQNENFKTSRIFVVITFCTVGGELEQGA